jgi:cytochrome b561
MANNSKGRSRFRYLHYLIYLVPIAIIILGYFAISYATNEPSPFTIVTGTSMTPTILAGSIAMIDKVPFDQLKIGEVIVFSPPAASSGICDNNSGSIPGIDFWITESMYVGMVILQLPIAGYITQPPYNEYLGVLLLALFIIELFWERKSASPPEVAKAATASGASIS